MKTKVLIFGLLFAVFFFYSLSYSQVPQMMNYQGKLTTPEGGIIDTTVSMEFKIYDDSVGGTILWSETQSAVGVEYGVFSVLLGSLNPIPFDIWGSGPRYLGVTIGTGSEMTPRKLMATVPAAFTTAKGDCWECPASPNPNITYLAQLTDRVLIGTDVDNPYAKALLVHGNPTGVDCIQMVTGTFENPASYSRGILVDYGYNPTDNGNGELTGVHSRSWDFTGYNVGTVTSVLAEVEHDGMGNLENGYGVKAKVVGSMHHGTMTNAFGVSTTIEGMLGDITNAYGVYIDDNQGMITNSFGVYQAGSDDSSYFAGKVGIGTTSPAEYKLKVEGEDCGIYAVATQGSDTHRPFAVTADLNTSNAVPNGGGFGTWLNTANAPSIGNVIGGLFSVDDPADKHVRGIHISLAHEDADDYGLQIAYIDTPAYAIYSDCTGKVYFAGNVGIGTATPAYKLDVNGDINVAGAYNVKKGGVNYNHPDYVFEPDYRLMPLDELKKYVYEKKCLPNVISAEDVKKNNGFKMDELLIQMLEKIEEQTLYILQLEERIAKLERERQ